MTRPSAKALITTGLCLLGGAVLLQIVYMIVQSVGLGSFYGGYSIGWGALSLFGTLISLAGYTGAAILAGGLVVKALTPTRSATQLPDQYGTPGGYTSGSYGQATQGTNTGAGQYGYPTTPVAQPGSQPGGAPGPAAPYGQQPGAGSSWQSHPGDTGPQSHG
ncbi:hypothetical protein [Cellulomonas sp. NPDC089187]|uniref:hypothetical protein n=1 Tax=Cellulomonas sp. NPDC089187 TaxID=3154970 RepID=UPI0034160994